VLFPLLWQPHGHSGPRRYTADRAAPSEPWFDSAPSRQYPDATCPLREAMKPPILNHLALSVPRALVSDTADRRRLLDFYERVFGWRSIELMQVEGERVVLHLHQVTHFLFLVGSDAPLTAPSGDHFGIEVYERRALDGVVDRARTFRETDPAVEISDVGLEDYGTIRIHNVYIRYLLPLSVEVQFYEGVEVQVEEIE